MRETEFGYLIDDYLGITRVTKVIDNKKCVLENDGLGFNVDFSQAGLKTIFELIFDLLTKKKLSFAISKENGCVSDLIAATELAFPGSIKEATETLKEVEIIKD